LAIPSAFVAHEVDLGSLKGDAGFVGRAGSGDAVPLVALGVDDPSSSVWLVDLATGKLDRLPDLPRRGKVIGGTLAASDRWVLLVVSRCPGDLAQGDSGSTWVCADAVEGDYPVDVLSYDRRAERWSSLPWPDAQCRPGERIAIAGDEAVLSTQHPEWLPDGCPVEYAISLGRAIGVAPTTPPVRSRCRYADLTAATFDAGTPPTAAWVDEDGVGRPRTVDLTGSALRLVRLDLGGNPTDVLGCSGSGRYVAEVAAADGSGGRMWDLDHLDRPPVLFAGRDPSRLHAGDRWWIIESRSTLNLFDPATDTVLPVAATSYVDVQFAGDVAVLAQGSEYFGRIDLVRPA